MTTPKRPTILKISWTLPEKMQWALSPYASCDLFAYPAYVDEKGEVCPCIEDTGDLTRFYEGLKASCFISSDYSTDARPMGSYGVVYDRYDQVGSISLDKAARMYRTLRSIDMKMQKFSNLGGRADDFCGHLIHFGRAIGAKQAYMAEGEGTFMPLVDLTPIVKAKALDLSIQCRILAGKYNSKVEVWTTAPADYDWGETLEIQVSGDYRQVVIEGQHYVLQTGRYRSGNHAVLTQAEFDRFPGLDLDRQPS